MRRTNKIGRIMACGLLSLLPAVAALAVTDKEMEEARTITAKAYLRYANNGSGYLDEVNVKTMEELEAKLKQKEKDNLKAFNSVTVPKDYASWDKARLVEFWSVTFFTSQALDENGKIAKSRVKKQLEAMNIAAPSASSAEVAPEASPVESELTATPVPGAEEAIAEQENILNDQKAIEKDAADAAQPSVPKEQSHTWLYIIVLAVLVGLIIWLVVYAANLMKRQPGAPMGEADPEETEKLREQTRKAIAKKNEEMAKLQERLNEEESKCAELGMQLERAKRDLHRQEEELDRLREENMRMKSNSAKIETTVAPEVREETKRQDAKDEKKILKVIYLGRANARGIFVRADRRINPGNTIYRLDTNDGLVGTFHVVDEPEVVDVALSNPVDYLANGCSGEDLEDTAGVTRIVTESAGTAIFENGYWKILRKTRIRYE